VGAGGIIFKKAAPFGGFQQTDSRQQTTSTRDSRSSRKNRELQQCGLIFFKKYSVQRASESLAPKMSHDESDEMVGSRAGRKVGTLGLQGVQRAACPNANRNRRDWLLVEASPSSSHCGLPFLRLQLSTVREGQADVLYTACTNQSAL
jgi:hypothetical protein